MWRPFASGFANHAYDNFVKKYDRVESAPINARKDFYENCEINSDDSIKSMSHEARKHIENFNHLKLKVVEQRKKIKDTDFEILKRNEFRIKNIKSRQETEKHRKRQYIKDLRSFSSNKTRRLHSLDLRPKIHKNKRSSRPETTIFMLTTPPRHQYNLAAFSPASTQHQKQKNVVSVREFQEKIMKDLKDKVPNYFKKLKEEFVRIRQYSEMTYEQYKDSKRLKHVNPYNILPKHRLKIVN